MYRFLFTLAMFALLLPTVFGQEPVAGDKWSGKVIEVTDKSISIRDPKDGENLVFVVNAATKITRNGKAAAISDIQLDDIAEIKGAKSGEQFVAKTVAARAPE